MGSTRSAAVQRLENLQGGESKSSGEANSANLETDTLHSFKHGTKVERTILYILYEFVQSFLP